MACSASDDSGSARRVGGPAESDGDFFAPPPAAGGTGGGAAPMPGQSDGMGFVEPPPSGTGTVDVDDACVVNTAAAEFVEQPVDIILMLDNSGSMADELQAVEDNLNVNFASILASSGVDYRVILLSRHRRDARDDSEEASTSVCVTTPLSALSDCSAAPEPVFSDRFFQYSTKLESTDSFDVAIDTYAPPFDDDEREEKFEQAPDGWSAWLRPGAKKVFLEMTDDNEDMPIEEFIGSLVAMAPEHFGTDPEHPNFVFHSIIGLAEKPTPTEAYQPDEPVQSEKCTGNDNDVTNAGESYQELSILTGGLRFPLCQFGAYDVVFQTIADDVVQRRAVACDFPIPPPPAGLELDQVAIEYAPGNGLEPTRFGQAPTPAACQPDAFYIANGRLNLCPDTCAAVKSDPQASVTALFTCRSQLIVPR
ncbi:MAG TPA: hypothetical protein VMG12_09155 [Polyangiaceae bacterium]|nr:hypothetical protein [Polyangiaceae bacterium]